MAGSLKTVAHTILSPYAVPALVQVWILLHKTRINNNTCLYSILTQHGWDYRHTHTLSLTHTHTHTHTHSLSLSLSLSLSHTHTHTTNSTQTNHTHTHTENSTQTNRQTLRQRQRQRQHKQRGVCVPCIHRMPGGTSVGLHQRLGSLLLCACSMCVCTCDVNRSNAITSHCLFNLQTGEEDEINVPQTLSVFRDKGS